MCTKVEIPYSTAPFFQEYPFDELGAENHRSLVIERILTYGNREEIHWVFTRYGRQMVVDWLQEEGCFKLPRLRYNMFCVILGLEPVQHPRVKKRIWPY